MKAVSALLALCEGNPPVASGFPSQSTNNVELHWLLNLKNWWTNNRVADDLRQSNAHVMSLVMVTWGYDYFLIDVMRSVTPVCDGMAAHRLMFSATCSQHLVWSWCCITRYHGQYTHNTLAGQGQISHINGSVQERRNSSALAMELRLSCNNPSIYVLSNMNSSFWMIIALYHIISCPIYTQYHVWYSEQYALNIIADHNHISHIWYSGQYTLSIIADHVAVSHIIFWTICNQNRSWSCRCDVAVSRIIFWAVCTQHCSWLCRCITWYSWQYALSTGADYVAVSHDILGNMHSALELIMSLYHMIFWAICTQHWSWLCRCITWYSGQYALCTGADFNPYHIWYSGQYALSTWAYHVAVSHIDGLVQDCSISIAYALEVLQCCTKP